MITDFFLIKIYLNQKHTQIPSRVISRTSAPQRTAFILNPATCFLWPCGEITQPGGGEGDEEKEKENRRGQFADVFEQATKGGGGSFHLHRLLICKQAELGANCCKDLITAARDVSSVFPLVEDGTT